MLPRNEQEDAHEFLHELMDSLDPREYDVRDDGANGNELKESANPVKSIMAHYRRQQVHIHACI